MTKNEMLQQMIAEYQKKIELYQAMIAEWQKELGMTASAPVNGSAVHETKTEKKTQGGDVLSMVRDWQFFNKTQTEGAKLLLEMVGHPLSTQQIIEALEKGGLKIGGKSPADKKQNFYTILARNKELGKAGRGTWGLMSWPNITRPGERDKDDDEATESKEVSE